MTRNLSTPPQEPADDATNAPFRWFLSAVERGNAHTLLDRRRPDGLAWSTGNDVRALIDGATYFAELLTRVSAMQPGDLLLFTDWRGDPDELLAGPGSEVAAVFAAAARRGVDVRGLLWRSHLDLLRFSSGENSHFGEDIEAAGGQCLLDMRVRPLGSHHQKLVVLRHLHAPLEDIAFIGGIDLCHGRHDDSDHAGDLQAQEMAAVYGGRPPWHDIQLAVQGPAVGDAETVFRERWEDPAPLSRNPIHLIGERLRRQDRTARALPPQLADPAPRGSEVIQLLRTYPRRLPGYPFAPRGEMSVARGYRKALGQARSLIYVEDQYLWSREIAEVFAAALAREPELRMIIVIPGFPDQDGRTSLPPNLLGREPVIRLLREAGGPRVAIYSLENTAGVPIYVHAKVCVIDDTWACVGSDNANLRSWTHDSELSCAVLDQPTPGGTTWPRSLRLELAREHLGNPATEEQLGDPIKFFDLLRDSADNLDAWHRTVGTERPPGQLRKYTQPALSRWTRIWATPLYRLLYDPDGRRVRERRTNQF